MIVNSFRFDARVLAPVGAAVITLIIGAYVLHDRASNRFLPSSGQLISQEISALQGMIVRTQAAAELPELHETWERIGHAAAQVGIEFVRADNRLEWSGAATPYWAGDLRGEPQVVFWLARTLQGGLPIEIGDVEILQGRATVRVWVMGSTKESLAR